MKLREKRNISFKEQLDHTESSGSEDEYKEESGAEEESDSMSEVEEEEEEEEDNNIESEIEEKKPKPKKKSGTKRKSPIIKKEIKTTSSKNKSNILMESDSEDSDTVNKSEKEILELQKAHFLNNGSELLNSNDFFRKRKVQLQSGMECTDFDFTYESDDSDVPMTDANPNDTTTLSGEGNGSSDSQTQTQEENLEEVTRELSDIVIKTLELGYRIPLTKTIQKNYALYLQNEMRNNPKVKQKPFTLKILSSPTINDDSTSSPHRHHHREKGTSTKVKTAPTSKPKVTIQTNATPQSTPTATPTTATSIVTPTTASAVNSNIVTPTTVIPTIVSPTTVIPTIVTPTTVIPTTLIPTTVTPTTVSPTSLIPTTVTPTAISPTTVTSTTVTPTTATPTTATPTSANATADTFVNMRPSLFTMANANANPLNESRTGVAASTVPAIAPIAAVAAPIASAPVATTTSPVAPVAATAPVAPEIPVKRKRGRPRKSTTTTTTAGVAPIPEGVATTTTNAANAKTTATTNEAELNSKNSIKNYFNVVPAVTTTSTTAETPASSAPRAKRRKVRSRSNSATADQATLQDYFGGGGDHSKGKEDVLKDVKKEHGKSKTTTTTTATSTATTPSTPSKTKERKFNPNVVHLFKCNANNNNFKCFFPSCNESFNTCEKLVKHLASCYHEISPFIENRYIEKHLFASNGNALELYKKLPLTDYHFESTQKYYIMVANRKNEIFHMGEFPLKFNLKRNEDLPSFKKSNISKNEKTKVYTPYPNKTYQINLKKTVFEWKGIAYETVRPRVQDFERLSDKKISQYTKFAHKLSVKFKHRKSKVESVETVKAFHSTECKYSDHTGYILNSGGSVWGLDWCPIIGKETQYLAVGGFEGTTDKHYVIGEKKSEKGCIQIWNVGKISDQENEGEGHQKPFLDLVLLHDYGYVSDLKWCPYGGYELESLFETKKKNKDPSIEEDTLPRLGVLAACFGDGSTKIFLIPHPHTLKKHYKLDSTKPLYVKLTPVLQFSHPDTSLWKCSWGHSKILAVACTNGCIAVFDIEKLLTTRARKDEVSEPYLYFPVHDACIQKIEFYDEMKAIRQHYWGKTIESEKDIGTPSLLISCSNDGKLSIYDLRDPWTNSTLVRLRAFFITASWVPHLDSIILGTIDNDVRMLNLKESCEFDKPDQKYDEGVNKPIATKALTVHNGSLWDMECSKYNSYIISGGVDGKFKLSNSHYWFKKKMKVSQAEIYQMEWDTKANQLTFIEGCCNEEINIVKYKNSNSLVNFFPPEIAIQKVKWNLNKESTLWVASGLSNGLVRLELL